MKRKLMKIAVVAAIALVSGINVFNAQKPIVLSDVAMENVEALAGCESAVETQKGREVTMFCINSSGDGYDLVACDFDPGYLEECTGRRAND